MPEIREIHEDELDRWVAVTRTATNEADTAEGYLDWKRQAHETVWLLASEGRDDLGTAIGVGGWHSPEGVARGEVAVVRESRGGGVGSALLEALSAWARDLGYVDLMGPVKETDDVSLAWAARRGFVEIGRNSLLALDLRRTAKPHVDPPDGIEIVSWAERPGVEEGMYAVAREAYPDVPGEEDAELASFEEWLSMDMQGAGDRPEATFVAFAGDEVVGFAKFSLTEAQPTTAHHDLTGVRRAWLGRGIAGALKATQVRWAKERGYERLMTQNEERNAPIRKLNDRFGYRPAQGRLLMRGPIAGS